MKLTVIGLAVGLVLGVTAAWGGFGAMAIVDAADSFAASYILSDACHAAAKPLVGDVFRRELQQPGRSATLAAQAALQNVEGRRHQKRNRDGHEWSGLFCPTAAPEARTLGREQQQVEGKEGSEHDRRLLGEEAQQGGQQPEVRAPPAWRVLVGNEGRDHTGRGQNLGPESQEVDRLRVEPVKGEERRPEQSRQAPFAAEAGNREDPQQEEKNQHAEQHMQGPLGHVETERIQPSAPPVIERERDARQGSVCRVLRMAGKGRGIAEEEWDVAKAAEVSVVLDDRSVIEMKPVVKVIRVGQKEEQCRQPSENRESLRGGP